MTREEAIHCLSVHSSTNGSGLCTDKQHYEAKQMAIKVLEQEPCEDAISRQAVLDLIADYDLSMGQVVKGVHALPPVTPQPKYEDIAKAFQFGLAFGFGKKYDETDRVIDEIKKVIT